MIFFDACKKPEPIYFGKISGKVINSETKLPMVCNVVLMPVKKETTTDANGIFLFEELDPKESYTLEISELGFKSYSTNVLVNAGETTDHQVDLQPIPSLSITSPTTNEIVEIGTLKLITWNYNKSENIKIELYRSSTLIQILTNTTENDSKFEWTIPLSNSLQAGGDYKIRISSISDPSFYVESALFAIVFPTIKVSKPLSSVVGGNITINWEYNADDQVKLEMITSNNQTIEILDKISNSKSYIWTIPLGKSIVAGEKNTIKITSLTNNTITASSDFFALSLPEIQILTPVSNDVFTIESSKKILWKYNNSEKLKIELFLDTTYISTISTSADNLGEYLWKIPIGIMLAPSHLYRIKLTSTLDNNIYKYSSNFSIALPTLSISNPTSSAQWENGGTYTINWNYSVVDQIKVELFNDNGSALSKIVENTGTTSLTIPFPMNVANGDNFSVKVSSVTDSRIFSLITPIKIKSPAIVVSTPVNAENWYTDNEYVVNWQYSVNENVKVDLYKGNTLYKVLSATTQNTGSMKVILPYQTGFIAGSDYKIKISGTVHPNVEGESSSFSISIPSISILSPTSGTEFRIGNSYDFSWNYKSSQNVRIDLYKNNVFQNNISLSTSNTGKYTWYLTKEMKLPAGNDYKIRISNYDFSEIYAESANFSIFIPATQAIYTQNTYYARKGDTLKLTNTSLNAHEYLWECSDGRSDVSVSPNWIFNSNGVYTITLKAKTYDDQISTATSTITIGDVYITKIKLNKISWTTSGSCWDCLFGDGSGPDLKFYLGRGAVSGYEYTTPEWSNATLSEMNNDLIYNTLGTYIKLTDESWKYELKEIDAVSSESMYSGAYNFYKVLSFNSTTGEGFQKFIVTTNSEFTWHYKIIP